MLSDSENRTSELYNYTNSNGVTISPSTTVKDLGGVISSDLSWHRHISTMVGNATKISAWALSLFQDRSKVTMLTLYKSLVRCRLDYCCPLWNPADITSIQAIGSVQQHFTKRISGLPAPSLLRPAVSKYSPYNAGVRGTSLSTCGKYDLQISFSESNLRLGPLAVIPRIHTGSRAKFQTLYDNSFAVVGPKL